ncbi:hypothetical protein BaRGS_00033535 [Batillaria attramentaria]|uniref:Copper type II ascorbate-dependent monooxygenase C-terminal domain-containing protein n=1 Tax=Batillaria attramentaria TaxID=370345 RepID=A0ABD0JKN1_9CAEN
MYRQEIWVIQCTARRSGSYKVPPGDLGHTMYRQEIWVIQEVTGVVVGVPYECGMSAHPNCSTIISGWTLGQNGECIHNNAGVRLGVKGYTKMALQFHWNNPELPSTYQDSSGMALHYTSNLRQYDSGVWMVGNADFDIFPRKSHVTVEAKCRSTCTKTYLKEPVYVTAAVNHMHYLGVSQTIEHYRNGTWLRYITNDVIYSYDSPQTQENFRCCETDVTSDADCQDVVKLTSLVTLLCQYITPIEVLPGDELKSTCHFNSMTRSKTTTFGDSTQQEMCFGFLTYYPEQALADKSCISFGSLSFCEPNSFKGCDWNRFRAEIGPFWNAVTTNCAYHTCYPECKETILAEQRRNPCLANRDLVSFFKKWTLPRAERGMEFLAKFVSCDVELYGASNVGDSITTGAVPTGSGSTSTGAGSGSTSTGAGSGSSSTGAGSGSSSTGAGSGVTATPAPCRKDTGAGNGLTSSVVLIFLSFMLQ